MRVLMPSGTVMEISKAIAICEQRVAFNGRVERMCECAKDIVYANGIIFLPDTRAYNGCGVVPVDDVLLGNLSNEFVKGVLASLVRQGYVDLTDLRLQEAQPSASHYVFDNGKSDAFMIRGFDVSLCCTNVLGYPFSGPIPAVSEAEDAGERESEGEDAGEEDCNE